MAGNGKNDKTERTLFPSDLEGPAQIIKEISKLDYGEKEKDGKNVKIIKRVLPEKLSQDALAKAVEAYETLEKNYSKRKEQYELEDENFPAEYETEYKDVRAVGKNYKEYFDKLERNYVIEGHYLASMEPTELSNRADELEMHRIMTEPQGILEWVAEERAKLEQSKISTDMSYDNSIKQFEAAQKCIAEMKDEMFIDSYEIRELESRKLEDEAAADNREMEQMNSTLDSVSRRCDILLEACKQ